MKQKILVSTNGLGIGVASVLCVVVLLVGCGQKGNLYLPSDPEFQERAKLPDILRRQLPGSTAPQTPASGTSPAPATAASAAANR